MINQYLEFSFHILESVSKGRFAVEVSLSEIEGEEIVFSIEVVDAFSDQSLEILWSEVDEQC